MELLLLLLFAPLVWFVLVPVRVGGRSRRLSLGGFALLSAVLLAGFVGFATLRGPKALSPTVLAVKALGQPAANEPEYVNYVRSESQIRELIR